MLNEVILVGRLVKTPELEKLESGKTICNIVLACPRSYKNKYGMYDTDFINCLLEFEQAERVCEFCKKGDLIGIKGRIETNPFENNEGEKIYKTIIKTTKVTFLSSYKGE